jgi:hypothetical protein
LAVFGETRSCGVIDFLMFSPLADFDVVMPISLVSGDAAFAHQLVEPGFDILTGIIVTWKQQVGDQLGVASEAPGVVGHGPQQDEGEACVA